MIGNITYIEANEPLSGQNGSPGEDDVLNRPLKELVTLLEQGKGRAYAQKISVDMKSNTAFDLSVEDEDVVYMDSSTGKLKPFTSETDIQKMFGVADKTNSIVHMTGVKEFTTYTFTKGKLYFISKTIPGKLVEESSSDVSTIPVGIAISTTELMVRYNTMAPVALNGESYYTKSQVDSLLANYRTKLMIGCYLKFNEDSTVSAKLNYDSPYITYSNLDEALDSMVNLSINDAPKEHDNIVANVENLNYKIYNEKESLGFDISNTNYTYYKQQRIKTNGYRFYNDGSLSGSLYTITKYTKSYLKFKVKITENFTLRVGTRHIDDIPTENPNEIEIYFLTQNGNFNPLQIIGVEEGETTSVYTVDNFNKEKYFIVEYDNIENKINIIVDDQVILNISASQFRIWAHGNSENTEFSIYDIMEISGKQYIRTYSYISETWI